MSQTFGRNVSHDFFCPAEGAPAPFASAARVFPGDSAQQPIFRTGLRRSLQLHRRMALAFVSSGLVLAVAYLIAYWSSYTAQSLIYIQPTSSAVLEMVGPAHWPGTYDPASYDSYIQQQVLNIKLRDVLVGALHKLAPGVWQQRGESDQSAADRLKRAIEVARLGISYQISVTAHASNPDTAAALANAVAASYIEVASQQQKASDAEQRAILRDERDRVKKELDDELLEQASLNSQPGVAAIGPPASRHDDDEIDKIHEELVKARTEHDEAAARLSSITAKDGSSSPVLDAKIASRTQEQLRADLERTSAAESQLNSQLAEMIRLSADATPKLQRSDDLAGDIARLQNLYSAVDEEYQNQLLEDNAPGTARIAASATVPLHPDASQVISNAVALLLGFVFLGVVAAVAAHKMDQRVCIASDVERLLGVAPLAQLPDFTEVSEQVADVHLLRLSAAFDYAATDGVMKSCVFTGTGPGAGVTTVANRLREKLETMGRAAILVDATGSALVPPETYPSDEEATTDPASDPIRRPIALLQQVTEQDEAVRTKLVIADTAPLAVSAETECLARFADCVIVVIESGVTTRAQLRRAAAMLQRLNLNAVGFVLNRVRLAKADPAFRNSVDEIEKHLRTQGRFTDWQAIRSRYFMAKSVRAAAEAEPPADTAMNANEKGESNEAVRAAEEEAPELSEQSASLRATDQEIHQTTWQPDDMPLWLTDALARFEAGNSTPGAPDTHAHDMEAPLTAAATGDEFASTEAFQGVAEEVSNGTKADSHNSNGMLFTVVPDDQIQAHDTARAAAEAASAPPEPASKKSRLSGLRGIVSAQGLKELEQARRPAVQMSGTVPAPDPARTNTCAPHIPTPQEAWTSGSSRLSRLRGIVSATNLREFGQPKQPVPFNRESRPVEHKAPAPRVAADPAVPKPPVPAPAFVLYPKPDSSLTGPGGRSEELDAPKPSPATSQPVPPQMAVETPRDRAEAWDALQILPSRRGQYRKAD